MDKKCDEAEACQSCLTAASRKEADRLRAAEKNGVVHRVAPGIYARPSYWMKLSQSQKVIHQMRGLQSLHADWFFAGPSAALVYGLAVSRRYQGLYVGTSAKTHMRSKDDWRTIVVGNDEVREVNGLRVTSLARCVGDSLRLTDFPSGLAIADSAVRLSDFSAHELAEEVGRVCWRVAGVERVRAVLALSDGRAESGGESIARAMMLELGMMVPDLQRWYDDPLVPGRSYRCDFAWCLPEGSIIGELDGNEKYTNEQMMGGRSLTQIIEEEHRRQSHIEARHDVLRFIRFSYGDVRREGGLSRSAHGKWRSENLCT